METFAPLNAALYRAADHGDKEGVAQAVMALDAAAGIPSHPKTEQKKESDLASARAQMAMYRLWAKEHQMGLKVVAGDSSWSHLTGFNGAGLGSPSGIPQRDTKP
ncbi:hypothetical protein [Verrucomicrobium sp. 3C]|uniref:hypothetical protein n=1 Tax=Verrucomicrobium sp. 3C TaxID=1134055 RepID=UPI0012DC0726|nr:hypothetical protein [Verrucomicrobium sp. 3C]